MPGTHSSAPDERSSSSALSQSQSSYNLPASRPSQRRSYVSLVPSSKSGASDASIVVADGESYRTRHEPLGNDEVPRLAPPWLGVSYWVLIFALVGTIGLALATRISDWAPGPALVRLGGRTDLTAAIAGTVLSIEVRAGQHVEANQLLVQFAGIQEQHDLQSANSEFQAELVRVLRDPGDESTRKQLAGLRTQKEVAEARLADRAIRAPRAGTVTEIRIRPHQLLQPGEIILTLSDEPTRPQVVAFLPGYARTQIKVGTELRFEPSSFDFAYQHLVIDSVGDEVLGPGEIRRYLGPELADAVQLTGPAVIVTAPLPAAQFVNDGKTYVFSHGLPGQASAKLRTRRVLLAFVPEVRRLLKLIGKVPDDEQ